MKSNYDSLGKYIRPVSVRNTNLQNENLIGLSISKKFIPSISNIIGTDMSTYRIINTNQFAYSPVTSRNGDKITIALYQGKEEAMISQAYTVFEITDTEKLLPEYLMMWFRRPEFDRYSRFMSHGSAREIFEWDSMCNTQLPVPNPDKQKEIVKEYNTIVNRIRLNEQLCQKLEETAQTIYKQWFVDFEFPDENGKPYKSNSGEMVYNEELEKEIPMGWISTTVKNFCIQMKSGGTPSRDNLEYWNSNDIPWLKTGEVANKVIVEAEEYISQKGCQNSSAKILSENTVLIAMYGEGKTKGQAGYLRMKATTNQACCAMICEHEQLSSLLYYYFRCNQMEIANMANGGAQPNLSKELIENIKVIKPSNLIVEKHPLLLFINQSELLEKENICLKRMQNLLLSKLATIEN